MEFTVETIVTIITIILTGLTAGLCFTWSNAITPGIGQLDDLGFLQSFQQMNRVIINPTFILVFFGPFISHMFLVYLKHQDSNASLWVYVAAAALFIIGVTCITLFGNVPLNEMLDKVDLSTSTPEELNTLREKFERPWRQWHMVRTITSIASFGLLVLSLLVTNQST